MLPSSAVRSRTRYLETLMVLPPILFSHVKDEKESFVSWLKVCYHIIVRKSSTTTEKGAFVMKKTYTLSSSALRIEKAMTRDWVCRGSRSPYWSHSPWRALAGLFQR